MNFLKKNGVFRTTRVGIFLTLPLQSQCGLRRCALGLWTGDVSSAIRLSGTNVRLGFKSLQLGVR